MKTMKNIRKAGFTLVEIMIVVAISGLLAAIAIPNFVKARATSQANACINNLRQIDAAANQWALENKKKTGDTITFPSDFTDATRDLQNFLRDHWFELSQDPKKRRLCDFGANLDQLEALGYR